MGSYGKPAQARNFQLLMLKPSLGNESAQIRGKTAIFTLETLPTFTVLCSAPTLLQTSDVEIIIDEIPCLIQDVVASALKRLRYSSTNRYLWIEKDSEETSNGDQFCTNPQIMINHAQYLAFWRKQWTDQIENVIMHHFYVIIASEKSPMHISSNSEDSELSMMVLQPSENADDLIDIKRVTVLVNDVPSHTKLSGVNIVEEDQIGSVIIDGCQTIISSKYEDAFRRLRHPNNPRYIMAIFAQQDERKKSLMQFSLKKPPECSAFWQDLDRDSVTETSNPRNVQMKRFVVLPNRYLDTSKYYTTLNTSSGSKEIRLLVLPPSNGETTDVLKCNFRNVNLDDPNCPSYDVYHVAGPEAPRDGRNPIYQYDLEIGGYLSVVSDGLRVGLQWLQEVSRERLIWNKEVCINCRDEIDVQHFDTLISQITKRASAGAVLSYGHLNLFTDSGNRNVALPHLNRESREIRLLQFLKMTTGKKSSLKCKLVVKSLDESPMYKALSYTWGNANGLAMIYTNFHSEENVQDWPLFKNSTTEMTHLKDTTGLVETISINNASFVITKRLANALRCLQERGDSKYFWIDAICIDQRDPLDRSSQVSLMGSIYSNAQQVIAWLGSGTEDIDRALNIVNAVGSESFNTQEFTAWFEHKIDDAISSRRRATNNSPEYHEYSRIYEALNDNSFISSINHFVYKKWWHRLWIYQEATLPIDLVLHCGNSSINFDTLWRGIEQIRRFSEPRTLAFHTQGPNLQIGKPLGWSDGKFGRLAQIRRERRRRHDGWYLVSNEFLFYLDVLGSRLSTDPRDIIYATLGLTDIAPKSIVPDYSKSIMSIYTEAAKATIKQDNNLSLLSLYTGLEKSAEPWALAWLASDPNTRKQEAPLPSWVPLWGSHHHGMGTQNLFNNLSTVPQFCAAGSSNAEARFSKDGRILFLRGICIDVITKTVSGYLHGYTQGSPANQTECSSQHVPADTFSCDTQGTHIEDRLDRISWLSTFTAWEIAALNIQPLDPSYILGGTKASAFMHCLQAPFLCNCVSGNKDDIDTSKVFSDFLSRHTRTQMCTDEHRAAEPSAFANMMFKRENEDRLDNLTVSKPKSKLIVTKRGYIGVVEGDPKEGDLLVVLRGGDVPFVLRKVGELERYLLVCDAYVHGLMYGAAMHGMSDDGNDFQKFPIM